DSRVVWGLVQSTVPAARLARHGHGGPLPVGRPRWRPRLMTTLRPAREADVPALVELAQRSWLSAFAGTAPAAFVRDRIARELERDWYPRYWPDMTVAEDGEVLLGVVQPMGDEVNGLWVDPAAQGRGIGTALLRHAERQIVAAGHGRAWL